MDLKEFFKRHWSLLILALLLVWMFGSVGLWSFSSLDQKALSNGQYAESSRGYTYDDAIGDFAPDVEERIIVKDASMQSEVKRGLFEDREQQLKDIVSGSNGFILNENVRESKGAQRGSYNIKIPADDFEVILENIKGLGKVTSFTQNARDVTGRYIDNDIELTVEKERLQRLETLYSSRSSLEDKLRLENAIFDQERKIKYLEESLDELDEDVAYSTLDFTLYEPENPLVNLKFVGFGDLFKTFVGSTKALFYFLFAVLPWVIALAIIYGIYRGVKRFIR